MPEPLEKFTEQAQRAFVRAYEEAARRARSVVLPEHLALALTREPKEDGAKVLERLGGSPDLLTAKIETALGQSPTTEHANPSLSPATQKAIELAVDEARLLHHKRVGTGHLVLGLLREGTVRTAIQLEHPRSAVHRARAEVLRLGEEGSTTSTEASPTSGRSRDRFDMFTERARRVLVLAQEEAQRVHHNYIGTEHLLLGLIRENEGIAARVLVNMGIELRTVRSQVEFIIGRGDRMVMGQIGLTPRAKKILELAVDEARRLRHPYIDTEHLLLSLVREGEGIAAGVLESLGVHLEMVRAQVIQILSQSPNYPHVASEQAASPAVQSGSPTSTERGSDARADPASESFHIESTLGELVRVIPIARSEQIRYLRLSLLSLEIYGGGFVINGSVKNQATPRTLSIARPILKVTDDRGTEYSSTPAPARGAMVDYYWRFTDRFGPSLDPLARTLRIHVTELAWLFQFRSTRATEAPPVLEEPWTVVVFLESEQAPPLSS
jgi:ATP-dependent Clp protease ATP-binding subunit ClpA